MLSLGKLLYDFLDGKWVGGNDKAEVMDDTGLGVWGLTFSKWKKKRVQVSLYRAIINSQMKRINCFYKPIHQRIETFCFLFKQALPISRKMGDREVSQKITNGTNYSFGDKLH